MVEQSAHTRLVRSSMIHATKTSPAQLIVKVSGASGTAAQLRVAQMELKIVIGSSQWRQNMVVCNAVYSTRCNFAPVTLSLYLAQFLLCALGPSMVSAQPHA